MHFPTWKPSPPPMRGLAQETGKEIDPEVKSVIDLARQLLSYQKGGREGLEGGGERGSQIEKLKEAIAKAMDLKKIQPVAIVNALVNSGLFSPEEQEEAMAEIFPEYDKERIRGMLDGIEPFAKS